MTHIIRRIVILLFMFMAITSALNGIVFAMKPELGYDYIPYMGAAVAFALAVDKLWIHEERDESVKRK